MLTHPQCGGGTTEKEIPLMQQLLPTQLLKGWLGSMFQPITITVT